MPYYALLCTLLLLLLPTPLSAQPAPPDATPRLLSASPAGLHLHWASPAPQMQRAPAHALDVTLAHWDTALTADQVQLPYATALLVLPPTGAVTLTTHPLTVTTRQLRAPLNTAPPWAIPPMWPLPTLPTATVTLTEIGHVRGVRLGQLTFVPLQYDPETLRLTHTQAVAVQITFAAPLPGGTVSTRPDPLHAALHSLVLNPDRLAPYPAAPRSPALVAALATADPQAQLHLHERGLYTLPWSALAAAGLVTAASDPARVQLQRSATDEELALHWDAAGQRYLFYADPQPTRWAAHEMYRVSYAAQPGRRMTARPASPAQPAGTAWATVLHAEQHHYDSLRPAPRSGIPWYWNCLERPAGATCSPARDYTFTLDAPLTSGPPATLTLWLMSYTAAPPNPDHHITAQVNGAALGTLTWEGQGPLTLTLSVPASLLQAGINTLHLALPGLPDVTIEGVWVEAFALRYPVAGLADERALVFTGATDPRTYTLTGIPSGARLYDISDSAAPISLPPDTTITDGVAGPHTYLIVPPAALRTTPPLAPIPTLTEPPGADYLILAPAAFIPALAPLQDFHAARGLTTFAAPLEAIYAAYGDGRMDPAALHAFVAHAYATWDPPPAYLLLVGDGTWDPLDHLGTGTPTLLPPYLVYADPWLGEIPADNRYVAVAGNDLLPDLAVGRLPVNTLAELEAVLAKIIAYATSPYPGVWNTRHVFVADDPDPAGDFPAEAEKITAFVPVTHTVTRLYCTEQPGDLYACGNLPEVRAGVLEAWNQGALVMSWVGHSAFQQWEHGRLFHTDDLPTLSRGPHYPLGLSLSCFTGHFTHPDPAMTGMDEALVRLPQAGAIATFGNSGLGLGSTQTPLHRAFYQSGLSATPAPPGVAATSAKIALAGGPGKHLIDGFHFLGDPALPLQWAVRPWSAWLYLPLVTRAP